MSSVTDNLAGQRRTAIWAGVVLLVLAAALYLLTLDNGFAPGELVGGDLITHQYAQVEARPSNAPCSAARTARAAASFARSTTPSTRARNPDQSITSGQRVWNTSPAGRSMRW